MQYIFIFLGIFLCIKCMLELTKSHRTNHIKKITAKVVSSEFRLRTKKQLMFDDSPPYFWEKYEYVHNGKLHTIEKKSNKEHFPDEIVILYLNIRNNKIISKPTTNYANTLMYFVYSFISFIFSYVAYCISTKKVTLTNSYLHEALLLTSVVLIICGIIDILICQKQKNMLKDDTIIRTHTGTIVDIKNLSLNNHHRTLMEHLMRNYCIYSTVVECSTPSRIRRFANLPIMANIKEIGQTDTIYEIVETGEIIHPKSQVKFSCMSFIYFAIGFCGLLFWFLLL